MLFHFLYRLSMMVVEALLFFRPRLWIKKKIKDSVGESQDSLKCDSKNNRISSNFTIVGEVMCAECYKFIISILYAYIMVDSVVSN